MLLKGIEEVARAPDQLAASEMVLVRLAHTADLPAPDEVIRILGNGGAAAPARHAAVVSTTISGASSYRATAAAP